jgi:hypothetical protein
MKRNIPALAALSIALVLVAAANATPIYYEFTVSAYSGALTFDNATGTFAYDSGSIVPGGSNSSPDLLTYLNFTWDGVSYNQATVNTSVLSFSSSGALDFALFGTDCTSGGCVAEAGTSEWAWDTNTFTYSTAGGPVGMGTVTYTLLTAIPEPAMGLPLFIALGSFVLVASIRRKRPCFAR